MARGRKIYEPPRYMNIETAARQLLEIEELRGEQAYTKDTPCVSISRLGSTEQKFVSGTLGEIAAIESGAPLHSLVMLGHRVHELELDFLLDFAQNKPKFTEAVNREVEAAKKLLPLPAEVENSD